ncbi:MAG: hypothetical protein AAGD04_05640 [Pseudomonadota bacterium]
MTGQTVSKTRLQDGMWEGVVQAPDGLKPNLRVSHEGRVVSEINIEAMGDGQWKLRIPIPSQAIADGIQTITISDPETEQILETITLLTGDMLDEDIRAEISLLREELDMLKRAFRRHCLETE